MGYFTVGRPACPVACRYCFITEHDARRALWNASPFVGINRACTYLNVHPEIPESRQHLHRFPWSLLRGDFVGFTAITDPCWPAIEEDLELFLEKASGVAKLVTLVTKWPIKEERLRRLSEIENLFLVVSVTGNPTSIERVSAKTHLQTLAIARKCGVRALPLVHPYIAGVSDLGFLPRVHDLGYEEIGVKGLRYDRRMGRWMSEASRRLYEGVDGEVLPEDGWREQVEAAGLSLLSPRQWYLREGRGPRQSPEEAEACVDELLNRAQVTSSSSRQRVREAAISRRTTR